MSSGHQRIKWRRNIAENFIRLSRVHEHYRQTDDRQTDGRRHIANMNMSSRSLKTVTWPLHAVRQYVLFPRWCNLKTQTLLRNWPGWASRSIWEGSSTIDYHKADCLFRPSVCLSVCLTNAWIVTKRTKFLRKFLYHIKGRCIVFRREEWLVGDNPFYVKCWA